MKVLKQAIILSLMMKAVNLMSLEAIIQST